jgi:segregation and condensation protein B
MTYQDYFAPLEAILFAAGEPVELSRLAEALELEPSTVEDILLDLMGEYSAKGRGIELLQLGDRYQLATKADQNELVQKALDLNRKTPLSQAAMEVLAIVAYNQPVTKAFVEQVRGVDSSSVVNSLQEKGLVEEAGRLDVPGRPIAYRTTPHFLRSFHLSSLDELPPLPEEPSDASNDTPSKDG